MNKIKKFFWLCSGANSALLEKCPTEGSKYVGIGATVFFTGIFAAIAASYAMFTVFENYFAAIAFGIVWGLMIFNLDRFIVSSMRKAGNIKKEFYMAIPRLVLAILISLVIAKPLEMKIFEKEIFAEYELLENQQFTVKTEQIRGRYLTEKQNIEADIQRLKQEILDKSINRDELRELARQEADGTGGSMRRNAGPIYQIKKADAERVDKELMELKAMNGDLIEEKQAKLREIQSQIDKEIDDIKRNSIPGPASRMDALSSLTAKSNSISLANWFILLLFIAVETAPVVVKLISSRGPYDRLLQTEERKYEIQMYEQVAHQNTITRKKTANYPNIEKVYVEDNLEKSLTRT